MVVFIILFFTYISILDEKYRFENFIYSLTVGVAALFVATEFLSYFKLITYYGILIYWLVVDIIMLGLVCIRVVQYHKKLPKLSYSKNEIILSVPIMIMSAASFYIALTMAPINYDSMTYHLSRIVHWTNNHSVAYYATHTLRQLTSPMLSEYIMLHYYVLLGGNDLFVNMVQAISYIVNAFIIIDISKKLNVHPFFAYFSSTLFMATPIVLAESMTTQNDVFATMWLLIFVDVLLKYLQAKTLLLDKRTVIDIIIMSICIAFGYLSKPNVCIVMIFFVVWLLLECLKRKDSVSTMLAGMIIAAVTIGVLLLPFWYRNYMMMGQLNAEITGAKQLVGTKNPRYLFINFCKNFTYNFPNFIDKYSSERIYSLIVFFAKLLNVEIDDPGISEEGTSFMVHGFDVKTMDSAVNPFTMIMIVLIVVPLVVLKLVKKSRDMIFKFSFVTLLSFLVFLVVLRWEPYISRYMICYFAILFPVIAYGLQMLCEKTNRTVAFVLVSLIAFCYISEYSLTITEVMKNYNRYDTREECYFTLNHDYYSIYKDVAEYIKLNGYKSVGILSAEDYYDYPLYKLIEDDIEDYKHVAIKIGDYKFNDSYKYEDSIYTPDVIFVVANNVGEDLKFEYNSHMYDVVKLYDPDGWISLLKLAD